MQKTKEQISFNMKQVKSKDSQIEIRLRKELWNRGLRYRKNVNRVFGRPDIAFLGKKVAVFCDSEFWHGYEWDLNKEAIKTRREFWIPKIEKNMKRDAEVNETLTSQGWIVLRFWGKQITRDAAGCADIVQKALAERATGSRNSAVVN